MTKTKEEYFFSTGKRKKAVARAKIEKGSGKITVNSIPISVWGTEISRLWIKEPMELSGDVAKAADISVSVKGGGVSSQAEAARIAIARSLVKFSKDKKLKKTFMEFDRNMMVDDPRRTEVHKPSRSKQGPRRHKQRSKR